MGSANPLWGAPRIHGELLKLGIEVSQATVAKYMVRRRGTPSQNWRTFLRNQQPKESPPSTCSLCASASFRLLYVMIVLAHDRRKIVRTVSLQHPTAAWISLQVTEAFPWDTAPRYLLRDRDASYGSEFRRRVEAMNITEVITAPRSPWQNAYVERVIGSIRRECLDHLVIFNERHLRRVLSSYVDYYQRTRTHLSLDKDCPDCRPIQRRRVGRIVAIPKVMACIIATNVSPPDSSRTPAHQSSRGGRTPASEESMLGGFSNSIRGQPLVVRIAARLNLSVSMR